MLSLPESLSDIEFSRRNRRVVYYFVGLGTLIVLYTIVYNVALARLEGVDQSIVASFEFVIQTMTTTGYGQDSVASQSPLDFASGSLDCEVTAHGCFG
ncbi:TrkA-N domain-containing protein [Halococcus thailandensis JCM 13552]|uniref:TrkA-N domain-containing protein n=2 Tax=Halococcus thailandensis TaxID=335952 RepID=M0N2M4_9EURY|nr:TrkA-N domain-containing protein [Halococcus thailandensis JCM 13552]